MSTSTKTIEDSSGNTLYPVTKATAVYMDDEQSTVEGKINTLNSYLTLSANSYTINGVTFVFRRFGRVVIVTSSGTATNAIPTNAYMGSVSVADTYKPISAEIQWAAATSTATMQFNLGTSGTLNVGYASSQIAAGTNIRMAVCYMASNQ